MKTRPSFFATSGAGFSTKVKSNAPGFYLFNHYAPVRYALPLSPLLQAYKERLLESFGNLSTLVHTSRITFRVSSLPLPPQYRMNHQHAREWRLLPNQKLALTYLAAQAPTYRLILNDYLQQWRRQNEVRWTATSRGRRERPHWTVTCYCTPLHSMVLDSFLIHSIMQCQIFLMGLVTGSPRARRRNAPHRKPST